MLGLATVIHGVVQDLIQQSGFTNTVLPELVEVAVIGTGLGMPRNQVCLVGKSPSYWDSTQWEVAPRPFLDMPALAYANAIASWIRDDPSPEWAGHVLAELKRPLNRSIKFLFKTRDSFFDPTKSDRRITQSSEQWWRLAASELASTQLVSLRHLESHAALSGTQIERLLQSLRSGNPAILLHAVGAAERLMSHQPEPTPEIVRELRLLTEHRNEEVSAKAMCAITRLEQCDHSNLETATEMLESSSRHAVFAGAYALCTFESIPDFSLELVDRCFVRALRACDYEFVELFGAAYHRWLDDPRSHIETLLHDSPEYLPVATEALK